MSFFVFLEAALCPFSVFGCISTENRTEVELRSETVVSSSVTRHVSFIRSGNAAVCPVRNIFSCGITAPLSYAQVHSIFKYILME